jgi:hypothetical protein
MRVRHGLEQRIAPPSQKLVFNSLGDEAAPISFHPVNLLEEICAKGDGDAF